MGLSPVWWTDRHAGDRIRAEALTAMRLLIYALNFSPELTGCGRYTGEMAAWLARRGHAVRVITAPPYYPSWQVSAPYRGAAYCRESVANLDVWRCPLWVPRNQTGLRRLAHLLSFVVSSFPLVAAQVLWRPEVVMVVAPTLVCAPAALLLGTLAGAATWLNVKDLEVDAAFDLGLLRGARARWLALAVERELQQRFRVVSTISESMRRRLIAKGREQIEILPDWVDLGVLRPNEEVGVKLRRQMGIAADETVVLYSGNLGQKQGLEIIPAAARMLQSQPRLRFLVCGNGGARDRLQQLAAPLRNMSFADLVPAEHLNGLLNLADIHLLPQRAEAAELVMPSKLLNMLAVGGAIVATAAPQSEVGRIVLAAGGLLAPPESAAALASAVHTLAASPARRQQAKCLARQYCEAHFDRNRILSQFEARLRQLAGPPRHGRRRAPSAVPNGKNRNRGANAAR
jgi:colanic acid biosynthesis glycosyl transferase WcaI